MKIKIFDEKSFHFFDKFTQQKLENAENLSIDMIGKKLGFYSND